MTIKQQTKMLLFRYNNYRKTNFIEEHKKVIDENGYVWMLKIGKKSSMEKLNKILSDGGFLVLRAPKADGSTSYLARFTEISECMPDDAAYPEYYDDFIDGEGSFDFDISSEQWFKLESIKELKEKEADKLILEKTGKKVDAVIGTTRTAVMFISCDDTIKV